MVPAGSLAETTLRTEVVTSGASPVRVDSCRAALSDSRLYIAAAVDFTNISPQPVNAVRFVFDVQDTFSAITQSMGLDWLGTFAPGVPILARRNLAGTVGAVGQENTASSPVNVICRVQYVRYADGRVWKDGDRTAPVAPGLYYPPTPAPSATPQTRRSLD
ncbi:MAG TPA: hypothetical protein VGG51_10860 [Candidatus Cybelea sp.]|jgi:hypothetical protein